MAYKNQAKARAYRRQYMQARRHDKYIQPGKSDCEKCKNLELCKLYIRTGEKLPCQPEGSEVLNVREHADYAKAWSGTWQDSGE